MIFSSFRGPDALLTALIEQTFAAQVLAYDIECTKAPLKFPNVEIDQVRCVSVVVVVVVVGGGGGGVGGAIGGVGVVVLFIGGGVGGGWWVVVLVVVVLVLVLLFDVFVGVCWFRWLWWCFLCTLVIGLPLSRCA